MLGYRHYPFYTFNMFTINHVILLWDYAFIHFVVVIVNYVILHLGYCHYLSYRSNYKLSHFMWVSRQLLKLFIGSYCHHHLYFYCGYINQVVYVGIIVSSHFVLIITNYIILHRDYWHYPFLYRVIWTMVFYMGL